MANITEVNNFKCKVFEPETAGMSYSELREMLNKLYGYYPYIESPESGRRPYDADSDYSKQWFQCYNHLLMLINMRKQDGKHRFSIGISILALVVASISPAVRLYEWVSGFS